MKRSFIGLPVLLVALVMLPLALAFAGDGVPAGAQVAPGPTTVATGSCVKASNIDFATADDTSLSTTSTSFVPVPGMSVTYTQKKGSTCAQVEYSAYAFAPGSNAMFVRAFDVTGGVECLPVGGVQFTGSDNTFASSHAFNFVCTGLTPGSRTIRIDWRSFDGSNVFTHKRSMFVHHK